MEDNVRSAHVRSTPTRAIRSVVRAQTVRYDKHKQFGSIAHNTTGVRCELCLPGHYGNPSLGGEMGACRPCACPTIENSHSTECVMTQLVVAGPAASQEDAYVCTACDRGYEGNKCEVCADGFFGDPMEINGTCKECECNDNIDLMAIGNCDTKTGICLKCIGDTRGEHCEVC
ncbi:laminin EGF-like protein [Dictyocaulus viviparus]|uniref:Laminin EGF-like protein n=1 Tax=Dictyocaulus viviparus TaxID=29172 RepID=A0A0D8Y5Y5_DICVI|nr:laminin EGF-like protein [Dictyocaulus viviparus]